MTTNIRAFTPFSLVIALFASPTLFADIELDTLFQRHAVVLARRGLGLQRGRLLVLLVNVRVAWCGEVQPSRVYSY